MALNRTLKRTLKITGIALGSLAAFVLLYFLAEYCLSRITVNKNAPQEGGITIYILTNGAHTDIVVPLRSEVMDWSGSVTAEHTLGKDTTARYVAFGWGDKGFYLDIPTWDDLTLGIAFRASFWLSTTAMHVTFYHVMAEGERCRSIRIDEKQYGDLVKYITDSFQKDADGKFILIETDAVYGTDDAFYEAVGRYSLFYTCNTWANGALKACGQKAALWTAFDTGIFYHYR